MTKDFRTKVIEECQNEVVTLRREFANTPIEDRGHGWDWLDKVNDRLVALKIKQL